MNNTFDVVIVGGGVGGLAVAWNLTTEAASRSLAPPSIAIVEASGRWGGNADTMQVSFGAGPNNQVLNRWVDLGVNDFNVTAYTEIVKIMNTIGFTFGANYKNLEDSTSYFTAEGDVFFTDNNNPWWGTQINPGLAASASSFMTVAGNDAAKNAQTFAGYTIEQYIDEQGPKQNPPWDRDLGPLVIYPRINGMYFVSELGPRSMPFLAVMHYYAIQEGAGGAPANRCYFVNGSSTWIAKLIQYMQAKMPNITFLANYKAVINQVATQDPMYYCQDASEGQPGFRATAVVLAAHADDCLTAMKGGLPGGVPSILASIRYNNGISVAHLDSRVLPVDSNAWCTYNILIHSPGAAGLKPYVINYVVNRHQNDAANPTYNLFGLPQFFVSCNPQRPIPDNMILRDLNGDRCIANLRHNNFDFDTLQAQADIDKWQGVQSIYYAGGWTHGAGLHEECWVQGQDVAAAVLSHIQSGTPKGPGADRKLGTFIGDRLRRNAKIA